MKFRVPFIGILANLYLLSYPLSGASQTNSGPAKFSRIKENGKINLSIKGFWKSIGNGYLLEATSDSIFLYSYTSHFCYKEKNDYLEGLLNTQAGFVRHLDTISIYFADYGERTRQLQIKNDFIKINALPENCMSFPQMQSLNPAQLFDLFMETLKENYAFSQERKLNWDSLKTIYGNKINSTTTREELFQYLGQVVTQTKDHHTKIIDERGKTIQYRGIPTAEIVLAAFKQQSEISDQNDYFNLFFKTNYKNISDSILHGKGKKASNGKLEWGDLNKKVGYLNIHAFTDFAPHGVSRKDQIDSIHVHMETIIEAFQDKDAIIIDISFNFGGFDAPVFSIAGFFTDTTIKAYTSQVFNQGAFYDESSMHVRPSGKISYTKPVYLLMSDISRSAAEGFAMAMKTLPHVTLVGTHTLGILSSMLGKSIGDFYFTSSNQRLIDPEGKYYEVTGVIPDIDLIIFTPENIFSGHLQAVNKIADMIEKNKTKN